MKKVIFAFLFCFSTVSVCMLEEKRIIKEKRNSCLDGFMMGACSAPFFSCLGCFLGSSLFLSRWASLRLFPGIVPTDKVQSESPENLLSSFNALKSALKPFFFNSKEYMCPHMKKES